MVGNKRVGQITSAIWSPRLECNVGQSMIDRAFWDAGQAVTVHVQDGSVSDGVVTTLPMC